MHNLSPLTGDAQRNLERTVIEQSHIIDDLEKQRTAGVRAMREVLDLLAVLPHANAEGNREVIAEYLDRSLTLLGRALGSPA